MSTKDLNPHYTFTAECIVFYTRISLNDRFTRYLKFSNPGLQKRRVIMYGKPEVPCEEAIVPCEPVIAPTESVILPCELDIVHCEPDIVHCKPDTVHCKPDTVHCKPDTVYCKPDIVHCKPDIAPCELAIDPCEPDSVPYKTKLIKLTSMFENAPLEQWWGSPGENSFAVSLQNNAAEEGSEPIIYTPLRSHSHLRMPSRNRKKGHKKKKLKVLLTKEELDDELDQYMIDVKHF